MMKKKSLVVSFSGGRTSAYMARWLQLNKSDEYDIHYVFANTGQEHDKTLEFIDKCDKAWGLGVVWLEAVINSDRGVGTSFKVVDFETAHRGDELFVEMCKVYGIPNSDYPHCNRELKLVPMQKWARKFVGKDFDWCIGIRSDEIDRVNPNYRDKRIFYPLAFWEPATKPEIIHWWSRQDFDLEIPEHFGNCKTCWKKSKRKLLTVAKQRPEFFECFDGIEKKYGDCGAGDQKRVFFRNYETASQIVKEARTIPFVEFKDYIPPLQTGIFGGIDELDVAGGCSESCEVFSV